MVKSMDTEALLLEIDSVFPAVEKPKGLDLTFHKVGCSECDFLREEFTKYHDANLPPQAIRFLHQEMSCLSAKGTLWVFPAYLKYCVTTEGRYTQNETEFLIYNLRPELKYQKETRQRLSLLNRAQIGCIINFLEWCAQDEHWSNYCPEDISSALNFVRTLQP